MLLYPLGCVRYHCGGLFAMPLGGSKGCRSGLSDRQSSVPPVSPGLSRRRPLCHRVEVETNILNYLCMLKWAIIAQVVSCNWLVYTQLKHYHQNILGIFRDVPVGKSGISSWESERCLSQAMVRKSGNGQNLLGICWEFWRNMQMRFTGTKCLIRHWECFPVWILGMLCKIPTRFSQCLIRHWEWWETAGNLLGNSMNYAN